MKTFAEIYDSMKETREYQVEELKLAFTESVLVRMEELNDLSRSELAARMNATKAYVSKLLKGNTNFTFETLVKLAHALDSRVEPPLLVANRKPVTAQIVHFGRRAEPSKFRPRPVTTVVTQNDDDNTDTAAAA